MTTLSPRWRAVAIVLSFFPAAGCRTGQGTNPAAIHYTARTEWGSIVLFEWSGDCFVIAGPPRIHAVRQERIIWRVYNACSGTRPASVTVRDLRRIGDLTLPGAPAGYFPDKPRTTGHEGTYPAAPRAAEATRKPTPDDDPLEAGGRTIEVERGGWRDLELAVRANALTGRYTYVVVVDGRPDQDQELEIWH